MSLVNIVGNIEDLDKTLIHCLQSGDFHPELAIHSADSSSSGFVVLHDNNPYTGTLNRITKLCDDLKINFQSTDFSVDELNIEDSNSLISKIENEFLQTTKKIQLLEKNIDHHEQAIIQLNHLAGLNTNFDDIFACKYVKVRFGKLPIDSFEKINYYDNKTFFFFPFDKDTKYYWGVYFAPITKIAVIDDIFKSLYFERMRVPDYAHGTPEVAKNNINAILNYDKEELKKAIESLDKLKKDNEDSILKTFCMLKFADKTFSLRKYVATVNNRFYVQGFIPKNKTEFFKQRFETLTDVSCVFKPYDADPYLNPPVKLKNNRFSAPFETFVKMYSLPSYKDIDPTNLVAITYTLLFGIMFGDLGQGLVLALGGFLLFKLKKMDFGRILVRIGLSSAFFGLVYGSVFGYEELLDPLYKALFGLDTKPIHVFDNQMTNILLGAAVFIGVLLIVISMCINIYVNFKSKNYEKAVFGHNGIAGLTLYVSAIVAGVSTLLLDINLLTPVYIIFLIVLPIIIIFLRHPLSKLIHSPKDFWPKNIGEFIVENIFELFEYILSYLSNSMSFLRVGGFILSHAGMMAVVMSLSEMVGGTASPFVVIIGNLFVMALEGLIVGIQALRLEFYEIFSRSFEGNGKPFEPATISYDK